MSIHDTHYYSQAIYGLEPDPAVFYRIPDEGLVAAYCNWHNRSVRLHKMGGERAFWSGMELPFRIGRLIRHRGLNPTGFWFQDKNGFIYPEDLNFPKPENEPNGVMVRFPSPFAPCWFKR